MKTFAIIVTVYLLLGVLFWLFVRKMIDGPAWAIILFWPYIIIATMGRGDIP